MKIKMTLHSGINLFKNAEIGLRDKCMVLTLMANLCIFVFRLVFCPGTENRIFIILITLNKQQQEKKKNKQSKNYTHIN